MIGVRRNDWLRLHEPVSDDEPKGAAPLLLTREDRYVNPIDYREDTYEEYHLRRLDSAESSREVIRHLHNVLCDGDIGLTVLYYTKLLHARYLCYGQCWSRLADSDAMWRIYCYGNKGLMQLVSNKGRIMDRRHRGRSCRCAASGS